MLAVDWQLTDTYFVVALFHYVLIGAIVFTLPDGAPAGSRCTSSG